VSDPCDRERGPISQRYADGSRVHYLRRDPLMTHRVNTSMTGLQGGPWFSSMVFDGSGTADAQASADAVRAFWLAISTSMGAGLTITVDPEVIAFDPATGDPTGVESTSTAQITTGGAGEPLPWSTQGLMRWRTGVFIGGKEVRGRTFIPALTEGHNTAGRPAAALLTILNAAGATLILASPDLQVYSRTHGVVHNVTARSTWTEWAELRTRRD
jgi:hypothetical protein